MKSSKGGIQIRTAIDPYFGISLVNISMDLTPKYITGAECILKMNETRLLHISEITASDRSIHG